MFLAHQPGESRGGILVTILPAPPAPGMRSVLPELPLDLREIDPEAVQSSALPAIWPSASAFVFGHSLRFPYPIPKVCAGMEMMEIAVLQNPEAIVPKWMCGRMKIDIGNLGDIKHSPEISCHVFPAPVIP